jgi:hypothetical protein
VKIALDYDLTYSADPYLWDRFIEVARDVRGYDVRIVTIRDDRYDRTSPLVELEQHIPIIYTRGVAKLFFVQHFVPDFWPVSVWIDDKPRTIFENSDATPEALVQWRAERGEP